MITYCAQKDTLQKNTLDHISISRCALHREPLWQSASHQHRALPRALKQWLFDPSSLTKKLIDYSAGQLRVDVIEQRIKRVRLSEYKALNLHHHRHAVVREVVLYGQEIPLVYARTIMPLSTLKGSLRRLHYLGNRSLGSTLFADPSMRRGKLEIAPIDPYYLQKKTVGSPLKDVDDKSYSTSYSNCWGRRSLFFLKDKPLLVCEVFLPQLINNS